MMLDFTLAKYAQVCEAIRRLGCPVMTVRGFLAAGQPESLSIVLRHDVDRGMGAALRMAKLESGSDIAATYYARTTPNVFKPGALRRLHELGHEVGYHYEVLAKAKGDTEDAIRRFDQELERFREVVPVETVSAHGSPLSPWSNLDLWQTHHLGEYGIVGDAVWSINGERLFYFTDTGRSWDAARNNLRDHLASHGSCLQVRTTDDLIRFLDEGRSRPIYISAHPNRWGSGWLDWGVAAVSDWAINQAKWPVSLARNQRGLP